MRYLNVTMTMLSHDGVKNVRLRVFSETVVATGNEGNVNGKRGRALVCSHVAEAVRKMGQTESLFGGIVGMLGETPGCRRRAGVSAHRSKTRVSWNSPKTVLSHTLCNNTKTVSGCLKLERHIVNNNNAIIVRGVLSHRVIVFFRFERGKMKRPVDVPSLRCCCRCKPEPEPARVTSKLLYRIAFTIWHVAFHIENVQQVN